MWFRDRKQADRERVDRLTEEISGLRVSLQHVEGAAAAAPPDPTLREEMARNREGVVKHSIEILAIRDELKRLAIALAEGIEHEERRERRIKATVRRARAERDEDDEPDPALEGEWDEIRDRDDERSEERGMRELPGEMDADPLDGPSSVPGVTIRQLRHARGLG